MSEVTNQLNHERRCSIDLEKKIKECTERLKKCEEEVKITQLEIQFCKGKTCDEEDTKSDIKSDEKQLNSEIKENDP